MRRIALLLLLLPHVSLQVPAAFAQEEAPIQSSTDSADVEAIKRMRAEWNAAMNAGDFDSMMTFVADNVILMQDCFPATIGKATMMRGRSWFEENDVDEVIDDAEIVVADDWAFLRGIGIGTTTPKAGGDPIRFRSRYLWILKRHDDGSWKYWRLIANRPTAHSCP